MKERQQNSSDAFKKEQNSKGVVKAENNFFLLTFFGGVRIDKVKIHEHVEIILQLFFHGHIFYTNYLYIGIDTYFIYMYVQTHSL